MNFWLLSFNVVNTLEHYIGVTVECHSSECKYKLGIDRIIHN